MTLAEKIRGYSGAACIIVVTFLLNIAQAIIYPIKLASLPLFRRASVWLIGIYTGFLVCLTEAMVSTNVRFAGEQSVWRDDIDLSSTIVISNHTANADWLAIYWLAMRRGGHGAIRWVLKAAATQIPVIGWGMKLHECIPLPHRTAADLTVVDRALSSFVATKSNLWLAIYPEGTFVDTIPKDRVLVPNSIEFCKTNNIPVHTHLLAPRYKGLAKATTLLRGHVKYLLDATMVFSGTRSANDDAIVFNTHAPLIDTGTTRHIPDIMDILSGRGPEFAHIHLRLIPMSDIPTDEHDLKTWLYQRWQEKEKLLAHFHEHGEFPGDNWAYPLAPLYLLRYVYAWVAWGAAVVWMLRFVPAIVWQSIVWSIIPALFLVYRSFRRQKDA